MMNALRARLTSLASGAVFRWMVREEAPLADQDPESLRRRYRAQVNAAKAIAEDEIVVFDDYGSYPDACRMFRDSGLGQIDFYAFVLSNECARPPFFSSTDT